MDLSAHDSPGDVAAANADAVRELCERVAAADAVAPIGGGTQWEVGGPPPDGVHVSAPTGVLAYDPHELTVTVAAGTQVGVLAGVLGAAGQECPLDPRSPDATVGGVLAAGLSGHRRLRYGPLRDTVLEVHFVTADGRLVKGGGKTVKNVSGYDVPRLLVGSLGTVGVLTEVTLRCRPLPLQTAWFSSAADPFEIRARTFRPSAILWDGRSSWTLLEGHPDDVEAERRRADLVPTDGGLAVAPAWPDGPHRGRISVRPAALPTWATRSREPRGSGGSPRSASALCTSRRTIRSCSAPRAVAESAGGWMLREAGAPDLDGFGVALPNAAVMARIKDAFDPTGKLSPGRLPLPVPEPAAQA